MQNERFNFDNEAAKYMITWNEDRIIILINWKKSMVGVLTFEKNLGIFENLKILRLRNSYNWGIFLKFPT